MPYISQEDRVGIDKALENLVLFTRRHPGYLNYAITKLLHDHLHETELSYPEINLLVGVLECVKLELYRQIAGPYEDMKKEQNGPVSNLDQGVITK